jgi:hypothetical protein
LRLLIASDCTRLAWIQHHFGKESQRFCAALLSDKQLGNNHPHRRRRRVTRLGENQRIAVCVEGRGVAPVPCIEIAEQEPRSLVGVGAQRTQQRRLGTLKIAELPAAS